MLRIKKTVSAFIISCLTLLLVSACAELDSSSAINRFQKSEDLYLASMRWGEWTNVLQLTRDRPEKPSAENSEKLQLMAVKSDRDEPSAEQESSTNKNPSYNELLSHLDTIKVTHTEVLSSALSETKDTAESHMIIEYRFDTSVKINSIRHKVSWWRDEKSDNWFTDTPLPKEFDLPKRKTIKLSPKRY
ncbi:MAG: hypothetical protein KAI22_12445 [Gammaproteobacteria bacterium]|nr:hypothetical protein [Gammaproteobacteria bacterium]